jgi:hypothetical protein
MSFSSSIRMNISNMRIMLLANNEAILQIYIELVV